MIDFTKPHNWAGLFVVILVVGFVIHQAGQRFRSAQPVAQASGF